ncbi:methionine/alanine import family NSS transporter small subunit [Mobilicoccus massiliensis]|nr:methionine/alanine import family NSS transporter small subunit [Mobilicoccus massiliensis]
MTPIAITFLILAIVLVWGGLAVSVVALIRSSDAPDVPPESLAPEGRVD